MTKETHNLEANISVCRECDEEIHLEILDEEWNLVMRNVYLTPYRAVDIAMAMLDKANKLLYDQSIPKSHDD